jgi:hypothetical protein
VIALLPTAAKVLTSVALPALIAADPRDVAPSKNVTFPVGPFPATVAVKVTAWFTPAGLGVTESVVVLLALAFTTRLTALEVLMVLLLSPPYVAVIVLLPTAAKLLVNVALPALIAADPRDVAPS